VREVLTVIKHMAWNVSTLSGYISFQTQIYINQADREEKEKEKEIKGDKNDEENEL
jgi:hypothetical protein